MPTVQAPSPSDSHLPALGVGCLDRAALWCLGKAAVLGKGDLSLVTLLLLPLLHHLLGSASAKPQVRANCRDMQYASSVYHWEKSGCFECFSFPLALHFFFQLVRIRSAVHEEGKLMLETREAFAQP